MKNFEAYLRTNGKIIVKQLPVGVKSFLTAEDKISPFLRKYLGILGADNLGSARQKFESGLITRTELVFNGNQPREMKVNESKS